jgi:hypothetical protein
MTKTTKNQDIESLTVDDTETEIENQITERAYYKAEKRGFLPGYEEQDWLEAEQEILENQIIM